MYCIVIKIDFDLIDKIYSLRINGVVTVVHRVGYLIKLSLPLCMTKEGKAE